MSDSSAKETTVTDTEPGPAEGHFVSSERLEPLNQDIRDLVAREPDRTPEELVPQLAAIMRKHGVPEPGLDGMVLWLAQARVTADSEANSAAEPDN